jgi:molybdate transport system substrate-binding protein
MRAFLAPMFASLLSVAPLAHAAPARTSTLNVFAAASLTESFTALAKAFQSRHQDLAVRFNFAGSQQLVTQLEQGAAGDVIATADERWMSEASAHGLLAGTPVTFAVNRLVVIVPRGNPARIDRLEHLARPGVKLVLGAGATPIGKYSRDVLRNLSRDALFGKEFARRTLGNLVSEEDNVKSVVAKVQLGEADAGIVYRSDVSASVARFVRVIEIPEDSNVFARYPIAALRGARAPDAAREFIALALSPQGQALLRRNGFMAAPEHSP